MALSNASPNCRFENALYTKPSTPSRERAGVKMVSGCSNRTFAAASLDGLRRRKQIQFPIAFDILDAGHDEVGIRAWNRNRILDLNRPMVRSLLLNQRRSSDTPAIAQQSFATHSHRADRPTTQFRGP